MTKRITKYVRLSGVLLCAMFGILALAACSGEGEHTHTLTAHETVAATCTQDGSIAYWSCAECGRNFSDAEGENEITTITLPATGHTYEGEVTAQPACTEEGVRTYTCTVCGDSYAEAIAATGHTVVTDAAVAPTCTETGLTEGSHCSVCSAVLAEQQIVEALGHDFVNDVCSICGAQHTTPGLAFTLSADETHYVVSDYTGDASAVYIPAFFQGLPVTEILAEVFFRCESMTSVSLPDSIVRIGENAFGDCSGLKAVYLTDLAAWCQIEFEDSFANPLVFSEAFYLNGQLCTDLVIPDGVTHIPFSAFRGCDTIRSVVFPDSLTSIGREAFFYCHSLTSIVIPEHMESIGTSAFYGCYKLIEVYNRSPLSITAGDEEYGNVGYYALNVYTPSVGSSNMITTDDGYLFYSDDVTHLMGYVGTQTKLNLPDDRPYSIYQYAFFKRDDITDIVIPDCVTGIGSSAFYGCDNVIQTENGVHYIDRWVFDCDTNVRSVALRPNTVGIAESAFSSCVTLTSISIPESVAYIGDSAFFSCRALTGITLPGGITRIGRFTFYWCDKLAAIRIPDGVTSIGDYAFADCDGLRDIIIPDSVTSIGDYAFRGCTSLTSITIGSGVTSIGREAFRYCYQLVEVYNFSDLDVTKGSFDYGYLGYYALDVYTSADADSKLNTTSDGYVFYSDGGVTCLIGYAGTQTQLTLPDDRTYAIHRYAFYNRDDITSITIPNSVTSIGDYALANCDALRDIIIPDSVTSIGNYAFAYSDSLMSVTIGSGVTSIGKDAFYDCQSLSSVTFENPNGWWRATSSTATSGTSIPSRNLSDPATAARYLTDTFYGSFCWKRS